MVFPEGFPLSQILPIEFIVDQHEFVAKCYANYAELGLEPGNPDDGEWQDAHYPAPKGEGDKTIPLLFEDHQIQGILQSEEYGKYCFFSGHTRKSLTHGPFVSGWFDLWDIYEKYVSDNSKKNAEKAHSQKDELGKSIFAMRCHSKKDEFGRSIAGVKAAERLNAEKDELGRSVRGVKASKRLNAVVHAKKDKLGRSVHSVKSAERMCAKGWEDPDHPELGIHNAGNLVQLQKRKGLPHSKKNRVKVNSQFGTIKKPGHND